MTPTEADLSPELRRRVRDLRSLLRRVEDDLERAEEEAVDLENRLDRNFAPGDTFYSEATAAALADLRQVVEDVG